MILVGGSAPVARTADILVVHAGHTDANKALLLLLLAPLLLFQLQKVDPSSCPCARRVRGRRRKGREVPPRWGEEEEEEEEEEEQEEEQEEEDEEELYLRLDTRKRVQTNERRRGREV